MFMKRPRPQPRQFLCESGARPMSTTPIPERTSPIVLKAEGIGRGGGWKVVRPSEAWHGAVGSDRHPMWPTRRSSTPLNRPC